MSHFTVLVVTNPDQNPEDLLAPFQEGGIDELDRDLLNFDIEYEAYACVDEARRIVDDTKSDDKDKARLIKMLANKEYKDIVKEWGGYSEDEDGNLGYWSNDNAHWDWYVLGGRWAGMLKVFKGKKGQLGQRGVFNEKEKIPKYHCDQAVFADIDFDGMLKDKLNNCKKWYSKAIKILEKEICKGQTKEKAQQEANWQTGIDLKEFDSQKKYLDKIEKEDFHTFAFINTDGEWIEEGDMGWFGVVSGRDIKTYQEAFNLMMKNIKPDQTLSVYDCHI